MSTCPLIWRGLTNEACCVDCGISPRDCRMCAVWAGRAARSSALQAYQPIRDRLVKESGRNTVSGLAVMKSANGESYSCAGQSANLTPRQCLRPSEDDGDLWQRNEGYRRAASRGPVKLERDDPALRLVITHEPLRRAGQLLLRASARRRLVCDDQRQMAGGRAPHWSKAGR